MYMIAEVSQYVAVASFAEAWIEIVRAVNSRNYMEVASFAEAWIEIVILKQLFPRAPSPPSRRRGLKSELYHDTLQPSASPPSRRRGLK